MESIEIALENITYFYLCYKKIHALIFKGLGIRTYMRVKITYINRYSYKVRESEFQSFHLSFV